MTTTENAVSIGVRPGRACPTFDEAGTVTREVAENTASRRETSAPRWRPWGPRTLAYTLVGSDAKYFNIDQYGSDYGRRRRHGHIRRTSSPGPTLSWTSTTP